MEITANSFVPVVAEYVISLLTLIYRRTFVGLFNYRKRNETNSHAPRRMQRHSSLKSTRYVWKLHTQFYGNSSSIASHPIPCKKNSSLHFVHCTELTLGSIPILHLTIPNCWSWKKKQQQQRLSRVPWWRAWWGQDKLNWDLLVMQSWGSMLGWLQQL